MPDAYTVFCKTGRTILAALPGLVMVVLTKEGMWLTWFYMAIKAFSDMLKFVVFVFFLTILVNVKGAVDGQTFSSESVSNQDSRQKLAAFHHLVAVH